MPKAPLQQVKDQFGSKEKLVDALLGTLERDEAETKDEFRARLLAAPNSKLLRLHKTAGELSKRFSGSREKLVAALLTLEKRAKDEDYREKLLTFSAVRLLSLHHAAERRAKRAAA